jgi:hypothetical protein
MESGYRFSGRHDKYMSLRIPDESQECGNLLPIPLGISFPGIHLSVGIACLLQAGFSRSCGIVLTRKEKNLPKVPNLREVLNLPVEVNLYSAYI